MIDSAAEGTMISYQVCCSRHKQLKAGNTMLGEYKPGFAATG